MEKGERVGGSMVSGHPKLSSSLSQHPGSNPPGSLGSRHNGGHGSGGKGPKSY